MMMIVLVARLAQGIDQFQQFIRNRIADRADDRDDAGWDSGALSGGCDCYPLASGNQRED
ncbi:hypothetical protein HZZ13_22005 [Bradyrhizobium sp. CNPSo 4010]|uniref:Uncharacterized protein n=1 Tax=Bradyrhizobium agreste TaxID=2751811 RepID=A0ABS0PTM8_9BRAD|nr:hypothetical protein [Bradyrhizobium agreste]MBH5400445.1 hypothetical protein [Bradyrhizobium agreste]